MYDFESVVEAGPVESVINLITYGWEITAVRFLVLTHRHQRRWLDDAHSLAQTPPK